MAKIKGKETKPEILVRKFLFSKGFRYRIHDRRYPGTPDIVLPKYNTTIFVHGCFWHGHDGCMAAKLPQTNVEFWQEKIEENRKRDAENLIKLKESGWNVIVIWECELSSIRKRNERLAALLDELMAHGQDQ